VNSLVIEPMFSNTLVKLVPLSATGIARPSRRSNFLNVCGAGNSSVSYMRGCV
jgi:hypothetical protein